ncbi:MAG: SIMPL domain-containing protein [Nitrososphaera sp.]
MSDGKTTQTKNQRVLLAGILAAGLLAAVFATGQLMAPQSATAQDNGNQTSTQPPVTSADDVDCATDPSLVHCAEDAELISAPIDDSDKATLTTSGSATTKTQPDRFTVTVGVETSGETAREAASQNANMTATVIAALQELGIAEEQMSTSSYSVYPVYGNSSDRVCIEIYPPPPECQQTEITGYKASSSISVTLDADGEVDAGQVIDTAIEAGANNVSGVYFFLSSEKQQDVRDGLIADAIADARQRADAAADALGMQVSGIHSVTLNDVHFPIFYSTPEALKADTQILPGEQEVTSTVSITYFISGGVADEGEDGSMAAVAVAREFILSKLSGLGIEIDDELDLHTDMVAQISENEYHLEFGVMDTEGQSHDGHIEIVDGEVTVAILDGESML